MRKHVEELTDAGLVGNSARILDGSFVEARKQRNTREENDLIKKQGKTAQDQWGTNPYKARQKDTDARTLTFHSGCTRILFVPS